MLLALENHNDLRTVRPGYSVLTLVSPAEDRGCRTNKGVTWAWPGLQVFQENTDLELYEKSLNVERLTNNF